MEERVTEFTYRPVSDKRRALPLFFALLFASAIFVAASAFIPKYKGVVSLVGMLILCGAVLTFTRYYVAEFIYSVVVNNEGDALFVVTRITGKRESAMCTLPIYSILTVEYKSGRDAKSYKPDSVSKKYNFIPDFNPEAFFVIFAKERGVSSEIKIYGTPELAERLKEYSLIERERKLRDDTE